MVSVIGLGYIGLPTSLMLASHNVDVTGVDLNKELVATLNAGHTTFKEDGLDALYADALAHGIKFTTQYQASEMYIVAVATPYDPETKKIDPAYVVAAVKNVLRVAPKGAIIVIESTISPSTIDRYIRPVIEESGAIIGNDIHLAHAPERIIPGNMVHELIHNSRTIGADDPAIGEKVKQIYSSFCQGNIVVTTIRVAEMTKVVENTYRDINIAFANELAKICHQANMDVYEVIRIANMHPRVNILQPGPGVGGHCIAVDPWFLVGDFPVEAKLIRQAREINDGMPIYVLNRIDEIMRENGIQDYSDVGIYGLTYKEDVDDTRESPALQLLQKAPSLFVERVKLYDPMLKRKIFENQYKDFDEFLSDVKFCVILTGHSHIKDKYANISNKVILDTRHIFPDCDVYGL